MRSTQVFRSVLVSILFFGLVAFTGCASSEPASSDAEPEEEVVNVGYGTQPRSKVTGSVSRVDADEVAQPVTRLEELLVGRVAGVQVQRTASGSFRVLIRGASTFYGSTEPLYIVDGVSVSPDPGGGLPSINPADVESIEVLKGPSAAMYGSRGGNGVVIVTTKRGG